MKNGVIGEVSSPNNNELQLINKYTRRPFTADEVYAFSVVLCDNDIDRDFERFTDESLEKMCELFIGKTGIFDHSHKSSNQCARIFDCRLEAVEGKHNRLGDQYKRLFARAYMPKSEKSKELILQIDAGIKKEVSVGCSMAKSSCSICGEPVGVCSHRKGRHYRANGQKKLCFFNLLEPTDAYEWSFVAIPAQREAGVVKAFSYGKHPDEITIGNLIKSVQDSSVTLSLLEADALAKQISELKSLAESAGEFISKRKADIVKLYLPNANESAIKTFQLALDRLNMAELYKLYNEGSCMDDTVTSQLFSNLKNKNKKEDNNFFIV